MARLKRVLIPHPLFLSSCRRKRRSAFIRVRFASKLWAVARDAVGSPRRVQPFVNLERLAAKVNRVFTSGANTSAPISTDIASTSRGIQCTLVRRRLEGIRGPADRVLLIDSVSRAASSVIS